MPDDALSTPPTVPGHACQVFPADAIYVIQGVNVGDGLSDPDHVCEGDVYALDAEAAPQRLVLAHGASGQRIAPNSHVGHPDEAIRLVARYSLMAPDGARIDVLLMRLASGAGLALPLSPISANADYTLVAIDEAPQNVALADLLCVSFARGTLITLPDGRQCRIESLAPGDPVLTRDHGAQPLRWLGQATVRAYGAYAPVVITAGTLGNMGDLIVSPHHRVFLYQRQRRAGLETSELLVQAKHLCDGEAVFQREGGFIDYFSLVFDQHEIIYAEGVPAESLMVNETTVSRLPPEFSQEVRSRFPGLRQNQHFGTEAGRQFLDQLAPGALLPRRPRGRTKD